MDDKHIPAVSTLGRRLAAINLNQRNNDINKVTIRPATASDENLVFDITRLINAQSKFGSGVNFRTLSQVKDYLHAGELAIAFLRPKNKVNPQSRAPAPREKVVGCVRVRKISPTMGEFRALTVDPKWRGTNLSLKLIRFAEKRCRELGITTMRQRFLSSKNSPGPCVEQLSKLGYVMMETCDTLEACPELKLWLSEPSNICLMEKKLDA
ncbi:hypothetical protein F4680DRAFT_447654 [Xylaria scruposa]|nr:hypothetical protein F4680DRAFT_447654 [Xylaria scruposa]